MSKSISTGDAFDAGVSHDDDTRTSRQRADEERAQVEDTAHRLSIKRDKAERHLADAERALADAEAQLKGDV